MMTRINIGDEISVPIDPVGLFVHRGLCVDFDRLTGEPIVAHNSRRHGQVREDRLSDFADGKSLSIRTRQTSYTSQQIQRRARQRLGASYNLTSSNCEDFVSEVLGSKKGSPQRVFWGLAIGVGFLYLMTKQRSA